MTHKTHWRKFIETNYLGGFDLADGKGGFKEITATINRVQKETVKNQQGKDEDVLTLHFDGLKPMILNVTNSKTMAKLTGSAYVEDWVGRSIIIGTEKVKAFGDTHDALRIRNRLPVSTVSAGKCTDCQGDIVAVGKVTAEQVKKGTVKTWGDPLCLDCAQKRKEAKDATNTSTETEQK